MKLMNQNDYQIMERLISLNQKQTKQTLATFLKKHYEDVVETKDYIFAAGDIPVALMAHMDTVFEKDTHHKRNELYYDQRKGIIWHPYGAGFDDRAGIFAILKIIKDGYKPHVIFTTDEEVGGVGASILSEDFPNESPFKDLKYVIELDRANEADCVFYDCDNPKFTRYVESFGFIEAIGSFSDIDAVCPEWGVAGVNLSIGYKREHTQAEILEISAMYATIGKVKRMLDDAVNLEEPFIYILSKLAWKYYLGKGVKDSEYSMAYPYYDDEYYYGELDTMQVKCKKCSQWIPYYEAIPVRLLDGSDGYYCGNCISDKDLGWCKECNEAFERTSNMKKHICPDCKEIEEKWNTTSKKSKNNSKK